jgi:hypothetical protein
VFAELKGPVRAKLERYQLIGPLSPDHFFPTLDAALDAFRRQTGAEWTRVRVGSDAPDDAADHPPAERHH